MRKFRLFAAAAAAATAISAMSICAFADRDFTAESVDALSNTLSASAGWAGGQWLIGSDGKCMENPLTIADLEAADYIEISYTSTDIPPSAVDGERAQLTFCYKFVTEMGDDGMPKTMEAYLPDGWVQYGPSEKDGSGHTYRSMDYFVFDAAESGTITVSTKDIVNSLTNKDECMYMWQFGIGCNTYKYDEDWVDEAPDGADYFVTVNSIKMVGGSAAATETPAPAPSGDKGSPDTGVEGIGAAAGAALLAGGVLLASRKRK